MDPPPAQLGASSPDPNTTTKHPAPSIWVGARLVRRELNRRRLRLVDLPPRPRRLGRVALALVALTAVLLAAYPLIETGSGYFPFTNSDMERTELSVVGIVVVFGGSAVAFALAAYAAPVRLRRLVAAGLALASFLMLPSDLTGGVQIDQLNLNVEWPLATWAMFLGLTATIALVSAAVLGMPRSRHTLAVLAATPPLCGLAILVIMARIDLPAEIFNGDIYAAGRLATTEAMQGAAGLSGLFVVLGIWAVIEYTKVLGATAAGTLSLRPRWWWTVVAVAAIKLAWIVAASAAVLPDILSPNNAPLAVVGRESAASLALAVAFVTLVGVAAARSWLRPGSAEVTTGVFWLLVTPIIAAFVLPTLLLKIVAAVYRFALRLHHPPADEWQAWAEGLTAVHGHVVGTISRYHGLLIQAAPLIAALTAIAVALNQWRRHRERAAAAPFLLAFGLWTLVPATALVLMELGAPLWDQGPESETGLSLFGNVSPITLDLGVTILALGLALVAVRSARPIVVPPVLLALLVVSSVAAYGDQFTPGAWAVLLFWVGLAFPVFIQFGLDAAALNKPGPDRSARVLFTLSGVMLTLSATYAALITGEAGPSDTTTAALVRQLTLMPLALAFVLAFASARMARDAARTGQEAVPASTAGHGPSHGSAGLSSDATGLRLGRP